MVVEHIGNLVFRSDFDSGNCARVEKHADEYCVWTSPDCAETEFETSYTTWFHFSVGGGVKGESINICIKNINKQPGLYQHDMRPVVRSSPSGNWERCKFMVSHMVVEGKSQIRFRHRFEYHEETVFFAFCYPYSYSESQRRLNRVEREYCIGHTQQKYEKEIPTGGASVRCRPETETADSSPPAPATAHVEATPSAANDVYMVRELLARSLDGRRVDLLTITSHEGKSSERMDLLPGLFPDHSPGHPRPHTFPGKQSVFITARVHPGETPSSFVFDGILEFLLRPAEEDARSAALRKLFVFHLIPMLNPDGVAGGHYRADTRGVNLNRCYMENSLELQPTIYAAQAQLLQLHRSCRLKVYIDLHAHATKRGVFLYGNQLPSLEEQVQNQLFARLVSCNSAYLEYGACNFSEKNMKAKDKRDAGVSKEGSGRVAAYTLTGLTHCYTLECNYNTGRELNAIASADNDKGRASPQRPRRSYVPKYTPSAWGEVGRGVCAALLDLVGGNPWPRLARTPWHTLEGTRQAVFKSLRSSSPYRAEYRSMQKKGRSYSSGGGKTGTGGAALSASIATAASSAGAGRRRASANCPAGSNAAASAAVGVGSRGRRNTCGSLGARRGMKCRFEVANTTAAEAMLGKVTARNSHPRPPPPLALPISTTSIQLAVESNKERRVNGDAGAGRVANRGGYTGRVRMPSPPLSGRPEGSWSAGSKGRLAITGPHRSAAEKSTALISPKPNLMGTHAMSEPLSPNVFFTGSGERRSASEVGEGGGAGKVEHCPSHAEGASEPVVTSNASAVPSASTMYATAEKGPERPPFVQGVGVPGVVMGPGLSPLLRSRDGWEGRGDFSSMALAGARALSSSSCSNPPPQSQPAQGKRRVDIERIKVHEIGPGVRSSYLTEMSGISTPERLRSRALGER